MIIYIMSVHERAAKRRIDAPEWKKELVNELLKPKLKRFPRRKVYSKGVDEIWTADLADFSKYSITNKGYKFILVVLDVFSRYAWARPLLNKTGVQTLLAFEDIFKEGNKPRRLWCDRGREFYNNQFKYKLLRNNNIVLYSTHNEPKAMIAERFIRTLRKKIESNYILTQSTVWYDILPQLIHEYNTTYHRSIKMTPEEARMPKNYDLVNHIQYNRKAYPVKKYMFNVGDRVRISVHKNLFEKGATANWSEEIFEIYEILTRTQPVTYRIKDMAGEIVEGAFYTEQLQKTEEQIYRIDRIYRTRVKRDGTKECFVKWSGYQNQFNQWIPAEDVLESGKDIQHIA